MTDKKEQMTTCGLDCFRCDIHERNLTELDINLISSGWEVPRDEIACKGCHRQDNPCRMKKIGVDRWLEEQSEKKQDNLFCKGICCG